MNSACYCCQSSIDVEEPTVCWKSSEECLCCVAEDCCDVGSPSLGCSLCTEEKEGEICRVALPCCAKALKSPTVLTAGAQSCLCCYSAQSVSAVLCVSFRARKQQKRERNSSPMICKTSATSSHFLASGTMATLGAIAKRRIVNQSPLL